MKEKTFGRPQITEKEIEIALSEIQKKMAFRLKEKGRGILKSRHEIYGIVAEEMDELVKALRSNSKMDFADELIDIAVACIVGLGSMASGKMDW